MNIILASKSPRRKKLLKRIVKRFAIIPSKVDERKIRVGDAGLRPLQKAKQFAIKAAKAKAKEISVRFPKSLVIGADTIVVLKGRILGKPKNKSAAKKMLKNLSGKTHQVITGLCLVCKASNKLVKGCEITKVSFNKLTDENIDKYLNSGDYKDKAGSYAIQVVGKSFIKKIEGDYDNVVGLPVKLLKKLLKKPR